MLFRRRRAERSTSARGPSGTAPPPQKGILRVLNVDDSLHSVYGSGSRRDSDVSMRSCKSDPLPRSRSVVLSTIEIREYARTVGDNPSCSSGPPVAISWEYNPETQRLSIDDYETRRPYRRNGGEMVLTREERDSLLRREWEVSRADIASAIRETLKIKHQRRHTVQNLSKEPVEVLMERAAHGIRRSLLFQSSTSQELQRLEQQYVAAQKAREAVSTTVPELPRRPQTITIHEDDGLLMNPDDDDDDVPLTLEDEADFASQSKEAVARDEQGRGQCTNEAPSSRLCEA